jgi:hypothetical protein
MVEGSDRVTFDNVEVISATDLVVVCDVGGRVVGVAPPQMLAGSLVSRAGDRGRLVLSRATAVELGLAHGRFSGSALLAAR